MNEENGRTLIVRKERRAGNMKRLQNALYNVETIDLAYIVL